MPAAVLYVVELVPSIEPSRANIFTHKTLSGSYRVKNKYLEKLLEEKGLNNEETWKTISAAEGSVAGLTALSEEEKIPLRPRLRSIKYGLLNTPIIDSRMCVSLSQSIHSLSRQHPVRHRRHTTNT